MYTFWILAGKCICLYFPAISLKSFLFSIKYLCSLQHFLFFIFISFSSAHMVIYRSRHKYYLKREYKIKLFPLMCKFKNSFYNLFHNSLSNTLHSHLVSLQLKYNVNFSPKDFIFRRNVCFQSLYLLFSIFQIKSLLDESSILLSSYWNLWTCLSFSILLLPIMIASFKSFIL